MEKTHSKTTFWRHPLVHALTFFIFLILSSFLVIANPNWNNFGNMGVSYSDTWARGTIFSSNYPSGNTNFTKIGITDGNDFTPLVYDFNSDGQNEIITFFSQNVRLYNNKGDFLSTYAIEGTICGTGNIINYNEDQYGQVVFMTSTTGGFNYYILSDYDNSLTLLKKFFLNTSLYGSFVSNCDVLAGVDFPTRDLWSVNNNGSVVSYNPDNDLVTIYPNTNSAIGNLNVAVKSTPFFHSGVCYNFFNGYPQIYFTTTGSTYVLHNRFDTETKTFSSRTGIYSSTNAILNMYCGNIGNPVSSNEVIGVPYYTGNSLYYQVMNYDLTNLFNITLTGASVSSNQNDKSNPIIADVNKDGLNELCYKTTNSNIKCVNNLNALILNLTIPYSSINGLLGMGIYNESETYQNLITSYGIFSLIPESEGNSKTLYNFSSTYNMPMPVAIENKASFKKDLIMVDSLQMNYYIGSGIPAVCGNDVCEYAENQFNCPADCFNSNNSAKYGTVQNGNQCLNDTWCVSGSCDVTKHCIGRSQGVQCTSSSQCQSGTCDNNGLCSQVYVTDTVKSFLELLGLGNVAGLMLVGLIIIFACIMIGSKFSGFSGGVFGAFCGVAISVLVFSLISLWFLFFFFMLLMVMGVLIFIFGRKSD